MTKRKMLAYISADTPIHSLTGAAKLVIFLLWSVLVMVSFKTPILLFLAALGLVLFRMSKIKYGDISFIIKMMALFLSLNLAAVYVFSPEQGVLIYGTRNLILGGAGRFTLTWEQLFYEFNIFLKYFTIIPPAVLLMVTTQPSELAASLNKIGVPYTAAYSVNLTLRYIPDVQRDFEAISQAQQARGLELSKKIDFITRLKRTAPLLLPLVILSFERIDVISRAMELRGFGKHKKRTWYMGRSFRRADIACLIVSAMLFAACLWITFRNGDRFFNPFLMIESAK
jgi:energy-coupling factor transport system permease protein